MYIKEVKIKNYRAFANEVHLNLKPNANQIEEDLLTNNFKKINDSEYFCSLASIGSANAKGKSSLLHSISDFFDFFKIINYKTREMMIPIQTSPNSWELLGINNEKLKQKMHQKYLEMINSLDFSNLNEKISFNHYKNDILSIVNKSKLYDEETSFMVTNAFVKNANHSLSNFVKNCIHNWKIFKNNIKESAFISVVFYDEEKQGDINVTIFDEIIDSIETLKYKVETTIENFSQEDFLNELLNYGSHVCHITSSAMFADFPGNELWMATTVTQNLILMYKLVAKLYKIKLHDHIVKKLVQIINIADSNIKNISFNDSFKIEAGILGFIFDKGNLVSPNHISMGTLKFILTFNVFANAIINHSQLILFDEIDAYLHISLVEFFKTWIRQSHFNIQMIFTSHNYKALTKNLSHKQMFLIDDDGEGTKKIVKISSILNKNNSPIKSLMEQKIGSHPSQTEIDECVWELIDGGNSINE